MRKLKMSELNRISVEEFKKTEKTPLIVILDNVRSLNNIGSVFRSSDAFLIKSIYLCGITATPPHKDIHKTALGSTDSVDWKHVPNTLELVQALKKQGVVVLGIEQTENAIQLQDYIPEPDREYAVIFGHEVQGIDQDVLDTCDAAIEIPQFGTKHSFNISVSVGIVLWELFRKIKLTR
ncbi:MAG: RNA methyltransferase [Flavobacteriaceae bacterium]|nr:RNA methyltransferase [Flavobacteriaceae bacterium]NNL81245.1 RNA methyltransferase [Flavobacteriaceae bacterium]